MEGMNCNNKKKKTTGRGQWNAQRKHKYNSRLNQKKSKNKAAWAARAHTGLVNVDVELGGNTTSTQALLKTCQWRSMSVRASVTAARGLTQSNGSEDTCEDMHIQLDCHRTQLASDKQVDTLPIADVCQKQSGCNRSDAQEEGGCKMINSQTLSGHQMSDCEPEDGCQDSEVQIQSGYLMSDSEDEDVYQMAADTADLDNAWCQSGPDLSAPQTLNAPGSMSAVVQSSQKAGQAATPGGADRLPACTESQACATADRLQAGEVQLSQPMAATSLTRNASELPDHQPDSNIAVDAHVSADATASAQQLESVEPKQAAFVTPAELDAGGLLASQPLTDSVLPLQSTAGASAASTPDVDPPRFVLSASPPHVSQKVMMPGATCEPPIKPAEPPQVQSSQKASPRLAASDLAQAHADETPAIAIKTHAAEKQLPQVPINIYGSKEVQHMSKLCNGQPGCSPDADSQAAAGACNIHLFQPKSADPAQAATVPSAGSDREGLLAVQAWIDQTLLSLTGAHSAVASPLYADLLKHGQPGSRPYIKQNNGWKLTQEPAELLQENSYQTAPLETAQACTSPETQALAVADRSQDAEQQLSQVHADTNVSKKVQNMNRTPVSMGNCSPCTNPWVASYAGGRALPQQRESAESDQAACTMSARSASHGASPLVSGIANSASLTQSS